MFVCLDWVSFYCLFGCRLTCNKPSLSIKTSWNCLRNRIKKIRIIFCQLSFEMRFHGCDILYYGSKFTVSYYINCSGQYINICLSNGLVPNKRHYRMKLGTIKGTQRTCHCDTIHNRLQLCGISQIHVNHCKTTGQSAKFTIDRKYQLISSTGFIPKLYIAFLAPCCAFAMLKCISFNLRPS